MYNVKFRKHAPVFKLAHACPDPLSWFDLLNLLASFLHTGGVQNSVDQISLAELEAEQFIYLAVRSYNVS